MVKLRHRHLYDFLYINVSWFKRPTACEVIMTSRPHHVWCLLLLPDQLRTLWRTPLLLLLLLHSCSCWSPGSNLKIKDTMKAPPTNNHQTMFFVTPPPPPAAPGPPPAAGPPPPRYRPPPWPLKSWKLGSVFCLFLWTSSLSEHEWCHSFNINGGGVWGPCHLSLIQGRCHVTYLWSGGGRWTVWARWFRCQTSSSAGQTRTSVSAGSGLGTSESWRQWQTVAIVTLKQN